MQGSGGARRATIPHVAALDGVRGAAVAGVLLFHGGHLRGGYLGVDFFFTLSGFLITSLLLAESAGTGGIGLGGFWARRARRLLPALVVMLVGVAVYTRTVAAPEQLHQIRGEAFATLAYVANWHQIFAHQSYFALFTGPSPLAHTWSLAIEEQFYVVWPLLFVAVFAVWKRAAPKAVLATSLVLAGASATLMIARFRPGDSSRAYFGTDTRAAAILLGAALAAWLAYCGPTTSRRRRVALEVTGLAGIGGLAIAWTQLDGQSSTLYRGGFLLCGLAATAIIAAAVHPEPGPVARLFSFRPLCALGLISYGVYLYHWPLDVFFDSQRVGLGGWPLFAVRTAVTLAVAVASYHVIERPVRHGALTATQWRVLVPAAAGALALVVVVSTGGAGPNVDAAALDVPTKLPVPAAPPTTAPAIPARKTRLRLASVAKVVPAPPSPKATRRPAPTPTVTPNRVMPSRVMLVGNSVASRLGQAFARLPTVPRLSVLNAGLLGCTFPPEVQVPDLTMPSGARWKAIPCDPAGEQQLAENFGPQVVFWVVTNPLGTGGTYLGRPVAPCSQAWNTIYADSLRREIVKLRVTGAEVVITTAAYSRFIGLPANDRSTDCDNAIRRRVAAESGAQLVDLAAYTCPGGQCPARRDGVILRPDGVHYGGPGGDMVARWMLDQVSARPPQ